MNPDHTMRPRPATKTSPAAIPSALRTRRSIPPDTLAHSSTVPTRQASVAALALFLRLALVNVNSPPAPGSSCRRVPPTTALHLPPRPKSRHLHSQAGWINSTLGTTIQEGQFVIWLIVLPFAGVFIAALIMKRGIRLWISIAIASLAILVGATCLHTFAVEPSSRIDEQECVGATAIAWLIAFIWSAQCVGFLLKLIGQIREGNVDDEDRHHIRL